MQGCLRIKNLTTSSSAAFKGSRHHPHYRVHCQLPSLAKKAMDPISVLSIASSLIQAVDIGVKLSSVIRHASSQGRDSDNTRIMMLIQQLQLTVALIDVVGAAPADMHMNEARIEILDLANELLALSNKIDKANNSPLWRLPAATLRLASTGKQIASIMERFTQLHERIMSTM